MEVKSGKPVIFILGPTAVGKTATAIELAKNIDSEIISIDSRQIYRGLDIGTAKPTLRQQTTIAHHLIDVFDVTETISAGAYRELALKTVAEIQARRKNPIFVGGSGLYVNAVLKGIFKESTTDPQIRRAIRRELQEKGSVALYNQLLKIDPGAALKIHMNDIKRVTRALEIYRVTGRAPSQHFQEQKSQSPFDYRLFILNAEREELYRRINERVDQMLADGLVAEVQKLIVAGHRAELEALRTLGYQEVLAFLDGQFDFETMRENIKKNTRRYAKRQLTWFRNQYPSAVWIDVTKFADPPAIAAMIQQNLT
ncbi:MAG: tRNA (adenosine(37)-N6)-dimethylallyltransferase MiaA [Candidatus Marinimicrobia bacterium]|nr:tRNA (adenosine(37)-N6)-dimethylallyltransferase MiaA [Candidatus Neomarinimicrobiota bacterium]